MALGLLQLAQFGLSFDVVGGAAVIESTAVVAIVLVASAVGVEYVVRKYRSDLGGNLEIEMKIGYWLRECNLKFRESFTQDATLY